MITAHNLEGILQCPDCNGRISGAMQCQQCKRTFGSHDQIIELLPAHELPRLAVYEDPDYKEYHRILADSHDYFYKEAPFVSRWVQSAGYQRIKKILHNAAGLVLENGCGSGVFFSINKNINRSEYIMLDNDLASLKRIQPRQDIKAIVHGTAYRLPFRDNSFDIVFSHAHLEHLPYLDWSLQETKRVLKPHGKFIASVPTEGGFLWSLGRSLTSAPHFSKKLNIDYLRANRIDHFNTIHQIDRAIKRYFHIEKCYRFPFLLPSYDANLIYTYIMSNGQRETKRQKSQRGNHE